MRPAARRVPQSVLAADTIGWLGFLSGYVRCVYYDMAMVAAVLPDSRPRPLAPATRCESSLLGWSGGLAYAA